jgi:hypothetical protein
VGIDGLGEAVGRRRLYAQSGSGQTTLVPEEGTICTNSTHSIRSEGIASSTAWERTVQMGYLLGYNCGI